jgi:dihydropteroate synthase
MSDARIIQFPKTYRFDSHTHVMGVVNVTSNVADAIQQARAHIEAEADILDIVGDDMKKIVQVIKAIREESPISIAINTSNPDIAETALKAGATIINERSGMQMEPEMIQLAVRYNVPLVILHTEFGDHQEDSSSSWHNTVHPRSIVDGIIRDLENMAIYAISHGLNRRQIILDPGIGLGKQPSESLEILNDLDRIKALGYPLMIGTSRKLFVGFVTGLPAEQRLPGSLAASTIAAIKGANILRVDDVSETRQVAKMVDATRCA